MWTWNETKRMITWLEVEEEGETEERHLLLMLSYTFMLEFMLIIHTHIIFVMLTIFDKKKKKREWKRMTTLSKQELFIKINSHPR